MKKFVSILFIAAFVFTITATAVMAGGGKVRGDEGEGLVCQEQVNIQYPDLFK